MVAFENCANGKLIVGEYGAVDPSSELFIEGGVQLGNKRVYEFNAGEWLGTGHYFRWTTSVDGKNVPDSVRQAATEFACN